MNSNIIAAGNICFTSKEDPRWDEKFISRIHDLDKLKEIHRRGEVDPRILPLENWQMKILDNQTRCTYAKNDPCIGTFRKKSVCYCINGDCPHILQCNKNYSEDYRALWTTNSEEKAKYGNPGALKRYFLVDLVSERETHLYISDPDNYGINHPVPHPVPPDPSEKSKVYYRIDPVTGRKMMVIGYKWRIREIGNFEPETLEEIWGYADKLSSASKKTVKTKLIEKKDPEEIIDRVCEIPEAEVADVYKDYENKVTALPGDKYSLAKLENNTFAAKNILILLSNPAEMAYVSSTLSQLGIEHGYRRQDAIQLALIENGYVPEKYIIVSDSVIKEGCKTETFSTWKNLSEEESLGHLTIPFKDFLQYETRSGAKRWCCSSIGNGITHICVTKHDIEKCLIHENGVHPVTLVRDKESYNLFLKKDGSPAGIVTHEIAELINELLKKEEIAGEPESITGLSLSVNGRDYSIFGIGELKIYEY